MISPVMPTYGRLDVAMTRGEGAFLIAEDGRRFLDFGSGVAVTALGHAHPHLREALHAQVDALWHCSNLYRVPGQEKLAARLVQATFADTVFFCNSGAEAVEGCIKAARRYHQVAGRNRWRIIVTGGAFHGRTLATIAAGGQPKHLDGFGPAVDGFDRVSFGNMNKARAAVTPETAAILVEPIQGEGGINVAEDRYLRELRALADEYGILLILDEVQTGMGRTGALFAHHWAGIAPDLMASAKGLGGGFPVGAVLATEAAASGMTPGTHGSTFGGNPLAMAAANAVLDVMQEQDFMATVQQRGAQLAAGLTDLVAKHPKILAGWRGRNLMAGLACHEAPSALQSAVMAQGLLTVPAGGNVLRLLPPLTVRAAELDQALAMLDAACASLEAAA